MRALFGCRGNDVSEAHSHVVLDVAGFVARGGRSYDGHQAKCGLVSDVRRIDSWIWCITALARDGVRLVSMGSQQAWVVIICACEDSSIREQCTSVYLDVT